MKKETPVISHTEILSRAAWSIEQEIAGASQMVEGLPEAEGMLDRATKDLREKLEAVKTLYHIETGSKL